MSESNYFVAILCPEPITKEQSEFLRTYDKKIRDCNWIPVKDHFEGRSDSTHLTIKYFGSLTRAHAKWYTEKVRDLIKNDALFRNRIGRLYLGTTDIGYLEDDKKPTAMVWKVIEEEYEGRAKTLRELIDKAFDELITESQEISTEDFPKIEVPEHVFDLDLHLSLGRSQKDKTPKKVLGLTAPEGGIWTTDSFHLVESNRKEDGSVIYRIFDTISLI